MNKAISEWDKLWKEKPIHLKPVTIAVGINKYETRFSQIIDGTWLDRVQAVGDKMQSEIKSCENLLNTCEDLLLGVCEESTGFQQKLEAIREKITIFNTISAWSFEETKVITMSEIDEWLEVLGDE